MNSFIFFFNDTATTEIYTLSLHDALPIFVQDVPHAVGVGRELRAAGMDAGQALQQMVGQARLDRKSTRLNSSHQIISYAVFCLKKKKSNRIYRNTIIVLRMSSIVVAMIMI